MNNNNYSDSKVPVVSVSFMKGNPIEITSTPSFKGSLIEAFRFFPRQNIANYHAMNKYLLLSNSFFLFIDRGILEFFGPLGFSRAFSYLSFILDLLSTRYFIHYLLYIVFFISFFIFALFLPSFIPF